MRSETFVIVLITRQKGGAETGTTVALNLAPVKTGRLAPAFTSVVFFFGVRKVSLGQKQKQNDQKETKQYDLVSHGNDGAVHGVLCYSFPV